MSTRDLCNIFIDAVWLFLLIASPLPPRVYLYVNVLGLVIFIAVALHLMQYIYMLK